MTEQKQERDMSQMEQAKNEILKEKQKQKQKQKKEVKQDATFKLRMPLI